MAGRLPKRLVEAFKLYARAGFTVKSVERASKHWKVKFNEFPETQFLTSNDVDQHALKNNLARFKRLAAKKGSAHENHQRSEVPNTHRVPEAHHQAG